MPEAKKIRTYINSLRPGWPVLVIITILLTLLLSTPAAGEEKHPIALQPFGKIDKTLLESIMNDIPNLFPKVALDLREAIPLPHSAYYPPRKRYRAEKLLYYLRAYYDYKVKKKYLKIIGVTAVDISTTKGEYDDWGIFGLAFLDTGPCIISTYRLKKGAKSPQHLKERLLKAIIHELGHVYGLEHCITKDCVMQDAKGTIKTVDSSKCDFCSRCRENCVALCQENFDIYFFSSAGFFPGIL